ncbi:hypothetical protein Cni_G12978 [Canna indica]|uniref:F-box domain-containing protein n=1 Tax=Canna indica TaxID=4628 RepID=A0AAQ3K9G3_9LILI|nr:hypothetical protein Cni_G12978 [Canna indica]
MAFGQTTSENCMNVESQGLICGLPDDIAILCLARVPRRYHHVLRCVSRKWRNLLCSEEWHFCRRKNNLEETWIYVVCRGNLDKYVCYVLNPDPTGRSWELIQRIPTPCSKKYGISVESVGKKMYLLGGCSWHEVTDDVYCYDASANKWEATSPMPTARCYAVSTSLNDKLYICGGIGPNSVYPESWDIYQSNSKSWVSHRNPLPDYDDLKIIALDEKLYTIYSSWSDRFAGLYDPASATWQLEDNNKFALCLCGPTVVVDGTLYMLDLTFGAKLMKWEERNEWVVIGRLSRHLMRSGCHLVAIGRNIYVIEEDFSTTVIDVDEAAKDGRFLVTFSLGTKLKSEYKAISCNAITI